MVLTRNVSSVCLVPGLQRSLYIFFGPDKISPKNYVKSLINNSYTCRRQIDPKIILLSPNFLLADLVCETAEFSAGLAIKHENYILEFRYQSWRENNPGPGGSGHEVDDAGEDPAFDEAISKAEERVRKAFKMAALDAAARTRLVAGRPLIRYWLTQPQKEPDWLLPNPWSGIGCPSLTKKLVGRRSINPTMLIRELNLHFYHSFFRGD